MFKTKQRFIYMVVLGIVIALLSELFKPVGHDPNWFGYKLILIILSTIVVWEGNLRIDHWLNKRYPWIPSTRKRLLIQITAMPLFTVSMIWLLIWLGHLLLKFPEGPDGHHHPNPLFVQGVLISFVMLTIDTCNQFFNAWKQSLLEVERYKTESANAQLQNLKNQLNPHFLFNNLSVLTSLVYQSQDKAVDFINELSKVYRYVLDNKNVELVSLEEELNFLEHYIYLLQIRFGSSISFDIQIDASCKSTYLPPMCLQTLVENTIQHNEASQEHPLKVSIYTNNGLLIVENLIRQRTDKTETSKTGLANIQSRYAFFTDQKVNITNDGTLFSIALPLIVLT